MKILLVYPRMADTYFSLTTLLKITGKKMTFPPLGLLTVSSLLPADWNKKLVDMNVSGLKEKDILWADLIFISAMNVQAQYVPEIIRACRKFDKTIVAGGPLFANEYEFTDEIDHFILNEAEITLPPFLDDFMNGSAKKVYKADSFCDLKKTPVPDWNLVKAKDYAFGAIQYTRGCPYLCDFCDVTKLFGRVPRTKDIGQIIKELDILLEMGFSENILFAEDNLIGNKRAAKTELLPALIKWREKNRHAPSFSTEVTINLADDDELIQMMLEAGFRQLFIGIESVDETSLVQMRKKQNVGRDNLEAVIKLQEKGFLLMLAFIVGLDTDTKEVFKNQTEFIQQSCAPFIIINKLKAPPGTELYKRMEKEGRLLKEFNFDETSSNIIPVMEPQELETGYNTLLKNIYSPAASYARIMDYLKLKKRMNIKNGIRRVLKPGDILTVFRVLFYISFHKNTRKEFWGIIGYLLKEKPGQIDLGILLNVVLYHNYLRYNNILRNEKGGV